MHDPRLDKLARLLVDYSLAPEEGHNVVVSGGVAATPLIKSVYARLLQVGAVPFTQVALPGMQELYFKNARDEHYETTPKLTRRVYEEADGFVSIMAPTNTRALAGVDPAKQQAVGKRDRELSDLVLSRDRWILTLFPTEALAQESDMSLDDYAEFAFEAMALNRDDPVAFWKAKSEEQEKLKERLEEADEIRIVGPRTELTLSVAGRTFINSAGRHNMPCGEVFTGPVEDSANGHVFFDVPAAAGGATSPGCFCASRTGGSSRRARRRDRTTSRRCSTPTPGPGTSGSSGSGRTTASRAPRGASSSTRSSAGRYTSRSAAPTRPPAARTSRASTGTL